MPARRARVVREFGAGTRWVRCYATLLITHEHQRVSLGQLYDLEDVKVPIVHVCVRMRVSVRTFVCDVCVPRASSRYISSSIPLPDCHRE